MNWYVVYRGRSPGVYNSWRSCPEQVAGFSNNSYQGFETLQEAQANYMNYLNTIPLGDQDVIEHQVIAQAIPNVGNQVVGSRMKDFIIIVLVVVIVKLLLF
jgi:viroplasmin and RNaseH domain-containing protein